LYGEVDAMKGHTIDNGYYESHINIVRQRIEQAGIRLAGVLNQLFKDAKPGEYAAGTAQQLAIPPATTETPVTIQAEDAPLHIGETVKICAKAYEHKEMGSMVLVNMGAGYPTQLLTLVLRNDTKKIADDIDNKLICVSGNLLEYKGKPEIIITDAAQVKKQ
jgi:S1/P1 Nuclease